MGASQSQYRRLPGRKVGLLRRHTLWLGPDHLLRVRSVRFSEDYRRVYLRDIQAISLQERPHRNRVVPGTILGAGVLLSVVLWRMAHPVWAVLLAIGVILYGLTAFLGSDCEVWIQTAVGVDKLPSLRRRRPARKALTIINARALEAQKAATEVELATILAAPPPLPSATQFIATALPPRLPAQRAPGESQVYIFAFLFLLVVGVLKVADTVTPGWLPRATLPAGYLAFIAAILVPLIRRGVSSLTRIRAAAVLTSLGVAGIAGVLSLRWSVAPGSMTMRDPNLENLYQNISVNWTLHLTIAVVLILLAIWGLLAFLGQWESSGSGDDGPLTLFGAERP